MVKKISYLIYSFLKIIDFQFKKISKRSFLIWFTEFIEKNSYQSIYIANKSAKFFTPNYITSQVTKDFFNKEPETIEWIDNFKIKNGKIIFWDIGANIGIYSIYAALKHKNIEIISFEPSTSNLRILSRNISINKLEEKIIINQFPLSNKRNKYLLFKENKFMEGLGMHSWGENFNYEGKSLKSENKYKIYGTDINYLIDKKILKIPDFIKIDVDGIEHLILKGASKYLSNKKIKSVSIELNEKFKKQYQSVFKTMKKNNFYFKHKKRAENSYYYKDPKLSKIYNYIFYK